MRPKEFEFLVDAIKSLPSIGTKSAEKISYFLINQDQKYIDQFLNRIIAAKNNIKFCKQCGNFANDDLCPICANPERNQTKLCIVNSIDELNKIESTGTFDGIYFVLNDEISLKENKKINSEIISKLIHYCVLKKFNEIIIATNLTNDGEATNIYLKKILKNVLPNCQIYKLGVGLPINSSLNYMDEDTIKCAMKNKTKVN